MCPKCRSYQCRVFSCASCTSSLQKEAKARVKRNEPKSRILSRQLAAARAGKISFRKASSPPPLSRSTLLSLFLMGGFAAIGFQRLYPFQSEPTLADIAAEITPAQVATSLLPAPSGEQPDAVKARLSMFANEYARLKQYEEEIKRRVTSIDTLLGEIDRLEHGGSTSWSDSPSPTTRGGRRRREGLGGGDGPRAPIVHLGSEKPSTPQRSDSSARVSPSEDGGEKVSLLLNELDRQISRLSSVPIGSPVPSEITSGFGWRSSPFSSGGHLHQGVDFAVDQLSAVTATADGIVINAGPKGAYGLAVVVRHRGGVETLYAHLAKVNVKLGEKVCRGEQLGFVGSSGRSTGPHLHYEVRVDGEARDPIPYIELASFARLLRVSDEG